MTAIISVSAVPLPKYKDWNEASYMCQAKVCVAPAGPPPVRTKNQAKVSCHDKDRL